MRRLSDERLGAALAAAASGVAYPPTPELARRVRVSLDESPGPRRAALRPRRYAVALGAAALAIAFAGTMAFSPTAREAVADFIGVGGVRIGFGESAPSETPTDDLHLGPRVTLEEAEASVGFDVESPRVAGLPEPEIHLTTPPESGMVSLYYPRVQEGPARPALLFSQFEADIDGGFFKKLSFEGAGVEYLMVGGSPGYWVTGTHFFSYIDASGAVREETLRLAENVLLWVEGGVTYRVEGAFGKAEALEIAGSLTD